GKGKIVDILSRDADLVARFQGGANAGHTVVIDDQEFILHLVPTGILHPESVCVLGNGVVIDPEILLSEVDELSQRNVKVDGRLFISGAAHLTMPYHKLFDEAREVKRESRRIGTTHRGIGPTYADKMGRVGIRVVDLLHFDVFERKLKANVEEKNFLLENYYNYKQASYDRIVEDYRIFAERLKPWITDTSIIVNKFLSEGKRVLFEGAQGALLDVDFGTYPFVTSSNAVAGGACTGLGVGPGKIDRVLGVTKAYTTRVGAGPFPTEFSEEMEEKMRIKGKEYGATTRRPRRCGWFDALLVRRAVRVSGIERVAMTKLDVLDGLETLQICNGYRSRGEAIDEFPIQTAILDWCEPVYEQMDGWTESTRDARKLEDLPEQARKYLERISELVGVEIAAISVGPRRDELILTDSELW
ncbi:MAG: adenylosuccinate synthase, partial [bacterium]